LGREIFNLKGMTVKRTAFSTLFLCLAAAMASLNASADTLYNDGPTSNDIPGSIINYGGADADSFTLAWNSTVTSADFNIWLQIGDLPYTVDYAITTAPFGGTTEASGAVYPSATYVELNGYGYEVFNESFSIPSLPLSAGTYWLELDNAQTYRSGLEFWEGSDGPSSAFQQGGGAIGPEYFEISGLTPEPSSFLLLGSGLLGLAGLLKRKLTA
jgi:hypothetical protein